MATVTHGPGPISNTLRHQVQALNGVRLVKSYCILLLYLAQTALLALEC